MPAPSIISARRWIKLPPMRSRISSTRSTLSSKSSQRNESCGHGELNMTGSERPLVAGEVSDKVPDVVGAAQTDTGRVRHRNEDAAFFRRPASQADFAKSGALAMVADGMGGENGGIVASEIASIEVPQVYFASGGGTADALRKALETANAKIFRRASAEPELAGMGSTCVALVLKP